MGRPSSSEATIAKAAQSLSNLETLVATVKDREKTESEFAKALTVLRTLARKEDIPLAIVGGLAAIHHGYERFTNDIDVVAPKRALDVIPRVALKYGIKVFWTDPDGWHKLGFEGVRIDVIPEGGQASKGAPTTIPGPKQLGVQSGLEYASLAGWMETKLGSYRIQDQADVVEILKKMSSAAVTRTRSYIGKVDRTYVRRLDDLIAAATREKEQETRRGGPR